MNNASRVGVGQSIEHPVDQVESAFAIGTQATQPVEDRLAVGHEVEREESDGGAGLGVRHRAVIEDSHDAGVFERGECIHLAVEPGLEVRGIGMQELDRRDLVINFAVLRLEDATVSAGAEFDADPPPTDLASVPAGRDRIGTIVVEHEGEQFANLDGDRPGQPVERRCPMFSRRSARLDQGATNLKVMIDLAAGVPLGRRHGRPRGRDLSSSVVHRHPSCGRRPRGRGGFS